MLNDIAQIDPQHIYGGLITTLLRLVFLLYAEDEGLMPQDSRRRTLVISGFRRRANWVGLRGDRGL
ncbi:hypothetical protein [Chroococcidiopsis sp.]|uniref:hypothetical protein n=1 Tax=Chroococcidiopsis sp. TaxID=3088168 RepID=UPI003F3F9F13